ncbi:MAG: bifunctional enoyl-CoA hydratase/phosphate acetyltransferase [Chloroflexi bacterium]|nr:bifunctional enoyl-CoA hydratase/phosphate acetyltransferase [Chloroflexota bacterium]
MIKTMDELIEAAASKGPRKIAVAAAEDESLLEAVKMARDKGIAETYLIGDAVKIKQAAEKVGLELEEDLVIDEPDNNAAAEKAVALVNEGKAGVLMKGLLHTDTLLHAVLNKEKGLRTGRLLSHVSLFQIPAYHKLLFVTDVAMNIAPTLAEKVQITQNAVDLIHKVGIHMPKVAVVCAVEEVNEKMPATLDAAILSKMAERRQIQGAIVDGPLAFDNAISEKAAKEKKIVSQVAGDADLVVTPDIEAGNVLFKSLIFFAGAELAGVVVGARVPIILTSRADFARNKFLSIALGAML